MEKRIAQRCRMYLSVQVEVQGGGDGVDDDGDEPSGGGEVADMIEAPVVICVKWNCMQPQRCLDIAAQKCRQLQVCLYVIFFWLTL